MVNKTKALVIIFLVLFFATAFGQTDLTQGGGTLNSTDQSQQSQLQQAQLAIQQYSELSAKIDAMMLTNKNNAEALAKWFHSEQESFKSTISIQIIVIILAGIGLNWAIKLYLVSRGLYNAKDKKINPLPQ